MIRCSILTMLLVLVTPAHATLAATYFLHMQKGVQNAGLLASPPGSTEWVSQWIGYGDQSIEWRDPYTAKSYGREYWSTRDGWHTLVKYDGNLIRCTQVELVDINSGTVVPLLCPPVGQGHQYVPMVLPKDPWRLRVWGKIATAYIFYWETDFAHVSPVSNPCWLNGPQTRDALRQSEAWWSNYEAKDGGWTFGSGDRPFTAAGVPVRGAVKHGRTVTVAKDAGHWTLVSSPSNWQACLYSTWTWGTTNERSTTRKSTRHREKPATGTYGIVR